MVTVGVLALQGAFNEHIHVLKNLKINAIEIRTEKELMGCDGLILPGGESTTIALSAKRNGLLEPLRNFIQSGKPVWGTCAGMILLSNQAENIKKGGQELFGGLDIKVKRNAFGHQVDSFTLQLHVAMFETPFLGVFIRAPVIESVGEGIEILASVPEKENVIVACKKNNILVTAFHPELTNDYRFHEYFVSMIK